MNDVEIGKLIVSLTAEIAGFKTSMTEVEKSSERTAKIVEANAHKIEESTSKVGEYAKTAAEGLAVIAESRFFKESLEKFEAVESQMIRLKASIEINGEAVEEMEKRYVKFAKTQAAQGIYGKKDILGLIQQAESVGVYGDAAEKAAKQAMALGAIRDMSPQSFMRGAIALNRPGKPDEDQELHTEQLARLLSGKVGGTIDKYQQLKIIQDATNAGLKVETELAKTSSVQMDKLGRTFADIRLEAGGMIAEGIEPAIEVLKYLSDSYKELDPSIKKVVASIGALGGGVLIATSAFKLLTTVGLIPAITKAYSYFFVTSLTTPAIVAETAAVSALTAAEIAQAEALGVTTYARRFYLASLALNGTIIAGAVYGYFKLTKAIVDSSDSMKNAVEQTKQLSRESEGYVKVIKHSVEEWYKLAEEKPKDQMLDSYIQSVNKLKPMLEKAKKDKESYEQSTGAGAWMRRQYGVEIPQDVMYKAMKANTDKEIEALEEGVREGLSRIDKIRAGQHATSQEDKKAKDMLKSLKEQKTQLENTARAYNLMGEVGVETYRELQSELNKVIDMQTKHVDTDKLREIVEALENTNRNKKHLKLSEDLQDLEKETKKSIYTFQAWDGAAGEFEDAATKSSNAIKLWEFSVRAMESPGANNDVNEKRIENIKNLMKEMENLTRTQKIIEYGKSVTESNKTPEEKYEAELNKLNIALREGALNYDTYRKAVAKAKEEVDKLSASEVGITGTLKGSKEAYLQQYEFERRMLSLKDRRGMLSREDQGIKSAPNKLEVNARAKEYLNIPGISLADKKDLKGQSYSLPYPRGQGRTQKDYENAQAQIKEDIQRIEDIINTKRLKELEPDYYNRTLVNLKENINKNKKLVNELEPILGDKVAEPIPIEYGHDRKPIPFDKPKKDETQGLPMPKQMSMIQAVLEQIRDKLPDKSVITNIIPAKIG